MRTYFRTISRQRLAGRWSNFELGITAIVTTFGLAVLGLVAFTLAVETRYWLEGSVVQGQLLGTQISSRADQVQLRYTFETSDGRSVVGAGWTPVSRHLAKDPVAVEYARSDPTLNRPYEAGRVTELLIAAGLVPVGLVFLSLSLVPLVAARLRAGADRRVFQRGPPPGRTVDQNSADRPAPR